jgi:hypothetical protein
MRYGWEAGGRWEVGDGILEDMGWRLEVGDGRWEIGRWEIGNGRWKMGDRRGVRED